MKGDAAAAQSGEAPSADATASASPSYPAELIEQVSWNGETIVVRPIRPEDESQHREFVDRLDPEDQRLRFFFVRPILPQSEVVHLTHIDYRGEMAFIAVRTAADGTQQTLGVARAVIDPGNVDAELGIIVRSDLKGLGLGHLLLGKLIDFLASRGTHRLVAYVLHENLAMRRLAAANGFVPDAADCDPQVLCLVLDLRHRAQGAAASDSAV